MATPGLKSPVPTLPAGRGEQRLLELESTTPPLVPGGVTEAELPAVFARRPASFDHVTPEGKAVISPRSAAMLPTSSCQRVRWSPQSDCRTRRKRRSIARRCKLTAVTDNVAKSALSRNRGCVRDVPLNSLHSGNGFSPYQAQTWRRLQAGSRFRNPASDSAAGLSPALQTRRQFVADGGVGRLEAAQLGMNFRSDHEDGKLPGEPVEGDVRHRPPAARPESRR